MDHVILRDLRVPVRVGVTDEERAQPQVVVVNIDIGTDLAAAGAGDDVADTIDYHEVVRAVASQLRSSEARLLERLAYDILGLLEKLPRARTVTVEVAKEPPPVAEDLASAAVRIEKVIAR